MVKKRTEEVEEMEEDFDEEGSSADEVEVSDEVSSSVGGRGPQPPRLSITLPPALRKKIRLAAALADMEPNEWARVVIVTAAKRTVEKKFPDRA
jgi:hypothetical protein